MGKNKQKDKAKQEKPIFGSGAEPKPDPNDEEYVKCECTVCCADRGYHDVGDIVWIKRKLFEGDPFIKAHFKPLEPLPEGPRRQDGEEAGNDGESENAEGQDGHDGEEAGSGESGNGQDELGLK